MFPNFGLETRSAAEMNFEMRYLLHPVHFPYRKNQEDSKSPQWEKGTDLMSQWTANELAKNGQNYKEILEFFFEGTTITNSEEILEKPE